MSERPDVDVEGIARRSFVKRMGAALALAGTGCQRAPSGRVLPYVSQPPEVVPGNPTLYATALPLDGYAQGVLAVSREGRPIKIEGNPEHPASLGAAGPFEQARVLGLYDPDRASGVSHRGTSTAWEDALLAIAGGPWAERRGKGLSIVLEPTGSRVTQGLLEQLRARFPEIDLRWAAAFPRAATWEGARRAFGRVLEPRYDFAKADVVLVLDDDTFARGPAWLRWARQFADRRRSPKDGMSRSYVVEPRLTPTGASADHRLPVRRSEIGAVAAAILAEIAPHRGAVSPGPTEGAGRARFSRFVAAVARDLLAHRGRGLVVVGDGQPAEVHVLGHAIDGALGNLGAAKTFAESPLLEAGAPSHDLGPLATALDGGAVDTLLVLGPNVAYASPRDLALGERIAKARESFYLGEYADETAAVCAWSAPMAHVLETWADARAFDGTRTVVQPLIAPLEDGRTVAQVLAALSGDPSADPLALTRRSLADAAWDDALRRGVVLGSAISETDVAFRWPAVADAIARLPPPPAAGAVELALDLDLRVHDGRFTNVAWLAELPEPMTTLTWGNALLLAPETAGRLGLADERVARVEVEVGGETRALEVPVLVAPGQADDQATLTLGWGRAKAFSVAGGHGVDAYRLSTLGARWSMPVTITATEKTARLAIVQKEKTLHGREESIAPQGTLADLEKRGRIGTAPTSRPLALYANRPKAPRQWGMVVDLGACTGCSACVVACQAENNVPTVGPANVRKGREMHWLAINVYHHEGRTITQPMLCQHCEQAPCEYVCPVGATTHSNDGINEMTYNRCVGTRFCSNNCPYKVRRFNWFKFTPDEPSLAALVHNPDVTVRGRGVMEKCNYCVQRIRRAEIRAKVEHREMRDGDVVTACEAACPTGAIVFGDIADPASRVARLRADETRLYAVLAELGTVPRTLYLGRVSNPNPELA